MSPQSRPRHARGGFLTGKLVLPHWAYATRKRGLHSIGQHSVGQHSIRQQTVGLQPVGQQPRDHQPVGLQPVGQQWPPSPLAGTARRPLYRVWWSWAILGSVAVILGSVAFIFTPQSSPGSTLRKPGAAAPPASAVASTTTTPRTTTTTTQHKGQVTSSNSGNAFAHNVTLGDYAGEGDPAGVAAFAAATGTHPVFATDYLDKGDGWVAMASASNIKAWSASPYRLSIGVPILPSVGTLAQGATGAYNQYFTMLGKNLVSDNEADAVLRLGWEFNGNFFPWQVGNATDAKNFVAFWRQIVTTMRAVPGAKFKFLWNPNAASPTTYSPDQAYPGNAYVDYVGTDVYDNFWGSPFTPPVSWGHQLQQQWGLAWLAAFAAEHDKPIAIPEWSDEYRTDGHGLGDDALFIDNMAHWLVTNDVAFANIWCFDSSSTYRNNLLDGTFPKALSQFKLDFG